MREDCKSCPFVSPLQERTKNLEECNKDFEIRITKLERKSDVAKERTDMIFKVLSEIKDSIKEISSKMEHLEKRPSNTINKVLIAVASSIVTAIVLNGLNNLN